MATLTETITSISTPVLWTIYVFILLSMITIAIMYNPFTTRGRKTVSEIVELRIYPIKSCRGITVPHTTLTRQGLDLDRRWMFATTQSDKDLDFTGLTFVTIRNKPQMTLIDTKLSESKDDSGSTLQLTISIRNTDKSITIPARPTQSWLAANTTLQTVSIWSSLTDGYAYNSQFNDIFKSFFDDPSVSLVYKGPEPRLCHGNGAPKFLGRTESVNFPDVLPVLVASQSSLEELNGRLEKKGERALTIERFRPNIIIKGEEPWEEDRWKTIRINGSGSFLAPAIASGGGNGSGKALDLDVVARCARCQVPNVDPETAEKHKKEPWTTLMSYRRVDKGITFKPCFGMLCCPRDEGEVRVGMRFEVLEETDAHYYQKGF